jgi:hypothetical protein
MLLVFCDFDGVLRRASAPQYRLEPDLLENFERFVAKLEEEHDAVEIVLTTTWCTAFSIAELREHLGPRLHRKVVGTTPTLNLRQDAPHPRYLEILAYVRKHGLENVPWIAIDDQSALFPPGLDRLIACDPEHGFRG